MKSAARSLLLAAAVAALILVLFAGQGLAPGPVLVELWRGALGSESACLATFQEFGALAFCGLGIALAFRCGLWNIGAEGQFLCGAIGAAAAGQACGHWLPALLAGALAGAALAALPALLKVARQVPEVLATIMLNFVAIELLRYLVSGPLQERGGQFPQTEALPAAARLPQVGSGSGSGWHLGLPLAVLLAVLLAVVLAHTRLGLLWRALGGQPRAVQAGGFSPARLALGAFLLSGACAGLGGAVEVTGVAHLLDRSLVQGTGYAAIAVALLAGRKPLRVLPSALLFAVLSTGTRSLQWVADAPGIDRFARVVQGLVILAVLLQLRAQAGRSHG